MLDHPSGDVLATLTQAERALPFNFRVEHCTPTRPLPQDWSGAIRLHYAHLLTMGRPRWGVLLDDDVLLPRGATKRLAGLLERDEADVYEIETIFLWNDPTLANRRFPVHLSDFLFRCWANDDYPDDLVVHAPDGVRRHGRRSRLSFPLLHYGYLTTADREAAWRGARRAGKVDAHTLALVQEPDLHPWQSPSKTPSPSKSSATSSDPPAPRS